MLFSEIDRRLDTIIDLLKQEVVIGQAVKTKLDAQAAKLDELIVLLTPEPVPVSVDLTLGIPQPEGVHRMALTKKAKKLVKSGPPINMTDLQTDGCFLSLFDAQGLPVTFDPTKHAVAYTTSDSTILGVALNAASPPNATISTPTPPKGGTATVSAAVTFLDGVTPALPVATSPPITVTGGGTAMSADLTLGTPTP